MELILERKERSNVCSGDRELRDTAILADNYAGIPT